jgi:hypothetical protein
LALFSFSTSFLLKRGLCSGLQTWFLVELLVSLKKMAGAEAECKCFGLVLLFLFCLFFLGGGGNAGLTFCELALVTVARRLVDGLDFSLGGGRGGGEVTELFFAAFVDL